MEQPHILCKDGHYVRSKTEKAIDDFFYENNINHAYEVKIYCEDIKRFITPDWYLPDYCGGLIVEHFGEWSDTNELKIKFYRKKNLKFIYTNYGGSIQYVVETIKLKLSMIETDGYSSSVNGVYVTFPRGN